MYFAKRRERGLKSYLFCIYVGIICPFVYCLFIYFLVCIIYSSVYVCLFVCVCVYCFCVCMCALSLSLCVCVCVVSACALMYTRAGRRLSLLCVYYYYVSVCLLRYIIVLYFVRPLTLCSLQASQIIYCSLSLYCTKVSARACRRLTCSLFSECTALTC